MVTILFGCYVYYRLHNQLTSKHGLTGDMWKGARLELLDIAKSDVKRIKNFIGMVPFKAEANIKTITLTYLKPDCEQAIECMLPLPCWCHKEELKARLKEQEHTDLETIFENERVVCYVCV